MSYFTLTINSTNRKTGNIPVSTSSRDTCPDSCPFKKNGCYGDSGPVTFHWDKVTSGERGMMWGNFCAEIRKLPEGQMWRHNQAGDLPGEGDSISSGMIALLLQANYRKKGFTYTHKYIGDHNLYVIRNCNKAGFTINLSANSLCHADELKRHDVGPVVVVLPSWETRRELVTPGHNKVLMCQANYRPDMTCLDCGWCQKSNRDFIIGVKSHGSGIIKVDKIVVGLKKLW